MIAPFFFFGLCSCSLHLSNTGYIFSLTGISSSTRRPTLIILLHSLAVYQTFFFFALIFSPLRQVSFLNVTHSYYLSIPPTHQPACLPACFLSPTSLPLTPLCTPFFLSFFFILKNNNPTLALSISRCPPPARLPT